MCEIGISRALHAPDYLFAQNDIITGYFLKQMYLKAWSLLMALVYLIEKGYTYADWLIKFLGIKKQMSNGQNNMFYNLKI